MELFAQARVTISRQAQERLLVDIASRPTIEACGVLLGRIDAQENWHVEEVRPLPNVFNSPVYFEFAPEDLLAVELEQPGRIVGVYHSHPTGYPQASGTDRQNMRRVNREQQIPWVWLIVSGPFDASFAHRHEGRLNHVPTIAYHHYAREGLRQIALQLETDTQGDPQTAAERLVSDEDGS